MKWRKSKALKKLGTWRQDEASILEKHGKTKDPKLNGEQRPLGFGARQLARG